MPHNSQTQQEIRVLTILGADYYVEWEHLVIGGSFFIPTTATAKMVRKVLIPYIAALDMEMTTRNRCEYGRYGVRVWRVG